MENPQVNEDNPSAIPSDEAGNVTVKAGMKGTCLRCFNDGWNAHKGGSRPANFDAGFATPDAPHTCNSHDALVATLTTIRDAARDSWVLYKNEPLAREKFAAIAEQANAALAEAGQ